MSSDDIASSEYCVQQMQCEKNTDGITARIKIPRVDLQKFP